MKNAKIRQILVFIVAEEIMGFDVSYVREVLFPREVKGIPKVPQFIEGVITLRDKVIAVLDLRKRFSLPATHSQNGRIIITKVREFILGIIVDSVSTVIDVDERQIEPAPEVIVSQVDNSHILGIVRQDGQIISLLNPDYILTTEETDSLTRASS